jgi:hypothetical protein
MVFFQTKCDWKQKFVFLRVAAKLKNKRTFITLIRAQYLSFTTLSFACLDSDEQPAS